MGGFAVDAGEPGALREVARASLLLLTDATAGYPQRRLRLSKSDPARDTVPADVPASAGALIDRAGGRADIGGAMISTVHCNFIVNTGDAAA